ncbi:uncharacterized protein [Choristoneura fumiferana]|uniref:uncharacterized protein n=1 Tax=Choristoneura fumiferana TaxID=7141 RepID=UPI003D1595CE
MGLLFIFVVMFGACSVSASDTDLKCTNPHEVPDCLFACPPQRTCRNYKYALPCIPPSEPCKPQCVCEDGYARNLDGICITIAQCEQCYGYTQHFTCNGPYDEHCQGSCVCDDGYVRDANNTCVSTSPPPVIASPPPPPTGPANPPTRPVNPPTSSGPELYCPGAEGIMADSAEPPTAEQTKPTGETALTNPTGQTLPTEQIKSTD